MADPTDGDGLYDNAPTVSVFLSDERSRPRCERAVAAAGAKAHVTKLAASDKDLALPAIGAAAVLCDLGMCKPGDGERLSEALADRRFGDLPYIVIASVDGIDGVFARLSDGDIEILCDPDDTELAAAISLALVPRPFTLRDRGSENDETRLLRLSEEASRIARALAELSLPENRPTTRPAHLEAPGSDYRAQEGDGVSASEIRAMIRLRRLRDRFFDGSLFADPAWDMLLDLLAARIEGRQVSVSSLCIAAAVPPTTALRWIKAMTDQGLFLRQSDPRDGRRVFIGLSDEAAHAMEAWFAAAQAGEDVPKV